MGLGSEVGPGSPQRRSGAEEPEGGPDAEATAEAADARSGDAEADGVEPGDVEVGGTAEDSSGGAGCADAATSGTTGGRKPARGPAVKPRSRRFPTFTRDTARPEGGGRVAGARAPAAYRQWPLLTVCGGVLLGLLVVLLEFRSGAIIMGLSLIGAGVLRWGRSSVGMLAVRSRFTDVTTYGVLGCLITLLAMMAQPDPWITIPLLEDILHFSVQ